MALSACDINHPSHVSEHRHSLIMLATMIPTLSLLAVGLPVMVGALLLWARS